MSKNKIAIIADIPNWSFDIIAQLLKKELSDSGVNPGDYEISADKNGVTITLTQQ